MKLAHIEREHIFEALKIIDKEGVPNNHIANQFWFDINDDYYPFKYTILLADIIARGKSGMPELNFKNNESYRNYVVKKLDLKIKFFSDHISFFTPKDILYFQKYESKTYRKESREHKIAKAKILQTNWNKSSYWAKCVAQKLGFRTDGRKNWLKRGWELIDGENKRVSKFKFYTWIKLCDPKYKNYNIFFTVGVDAKLGALVFKLDCQYEGNNSLSKEQVEKYRSIVQSAPYAAIPIEDLHNYNWERLIEETVDLFKESKDLYYEVVERVFNVNSKIARITWNTEGWIKPSGPNGKTKNKSHEADYGYGHEEWLFDTSKVIDGYHYGFLEPIHKHYQSYIGYTYQISLFTIDGTTKQKYWVGTIDQVDVIPEDEASRIADLYREKGWLNEMINDLKDQKLDADHFLSWISNTPSAFFNVRYKPQELNDFPGELIPVNSDEELIKSSRYTLLNNVERLLFRINDEKSKGFCFEDRKNRNKSLAKNTVKKSRRSAIEIELKHNAIQMSLMNYLEKEFGSNNIGREVRAFGFTRVDVVRKTDTGYVFYEIKTYNQLLTSLREGIGQLLEYCLYPNTLNAEKLVLVSDVLPDDDFKNYLNHLRKFIKIQISYICFSSETEELIDEV
jgi:hypothetical protein